MRGNETRNELFDRFAMVAEGGVETNFTYDLRPVVDGLRLQSSEFEMLEMGLIVVLELVISFWFHGVVTSSLVVEWPFVSEGVRLHFIIYRAWTLFSAWRLRPTAASTIILGTP